MNQEEFIDYATDKYTKVSVHDNRITILQFTEDGVISHYLQDKILDDIREKTGVVEHCVEVYKGKIGETFFAFNFPRLEVTPPLPEDF